MPSESESDPVFRGNLFPPPPYLSLPAIVPPETAAKSREITGSEPGIGARTGGVRPEGAKTGFFKPRNAAEAMERLKLVMGRQKILGYSTAC